MDANQVMSEEQRTHAFREYVAAQMTKQTKHLDTIRSLMILWSLLVVGGIVFALAAGLGG